MSRFEHFCKLPPNFLAFFSPRIWRGKKKKRKLLNLPCLCIFCCLLCLVHCSLDRSMWRGTQGAAVRHFTTQTVNPVPAHTLRWASKEVLPSLPPPGASQTVPGSVGTAQGHRQQSQPPWIRCTSGFHQEILQVWSFPEPLENFSVCVGCVYTSHIK